MSNLQERNNRREKWLNIDAQKLNQIPTNHYAVMLTGVNDLGRKKWIRERIDDLNSEREGRWNKNVGKAIEVVVVIVSMVVFAQVPSMILKESGKGLIATSGGMVVGGCLGYFSHRTATDIMKSLQNRKNYQGARKKITNRSK